MQLESAMAGSSGDSVTGRRSGTVLIRDLQSCLPLSKVLGPRDIILVLSPAVPPIDRTNPSDPFEPFGRSLARHHPFVHHVPYLPRDGITDYHAEHIQKARIVIFIITSPPYAGQPSQVELSEVARSFGGQRHQVILACCSFQEFGQAPAKFPTVIEITDYTPRELQSAADLLFRAASPLSPDSQALTSPSPRPRDWTVDDWDKHRDLPTIHELWCQCLPDRFRLERYRLSSLLEREGCSRHIVVRHPSTYEVLGFCACYTWYVDDSESLFGSIALIIVKPSYRRRGIGRSLHFNAVDWLRRNRVSSIQLGSTFPRLLYGLPLEITSEDWFRRRGWRIDSDAPGEGREACDWILRLDEWHGEGLSASGLNFRHCEFNEFGTVMEFAAKESGRRENIGFYEQYACLQNSFPIKDIMLGFEGTNVVAASITYTPTGEGRSSSDLPWAGSISDDVGGVTCIIITDDHISPNHNRDSIMIRLLDACARSLRERGMKKMFLDAQKGGAEGFQSLGFQKWARYRDVWRTTGS